MKSLSSSSSFCFCCCLVFVLDLVLVLALAVVAVVLFLVTLPPLVLPLPLVAIEPPRPRPPLERTARLSRPSVLLVLTLATLTTLTTLAWLAVLPVRFRLRMFAPYDKSMLSRSSPSLSPTELSPELGGRDSSLIRGEVADGALPGGGPCILDRQVWMLGRSPPSTWTSPTSLPLPMIVPWYLESSPVLLCFFFRTVSLCQL